ncbi:MAG: mechanosensitive ion channel family protein, partial [bacterium]
MALVSLALFAGGAAVLGADDAAASQTETAESATASTSGLQSVDWGMIMERNTMVNWLVLLGLLFAGLALGKIVSLIFLRLGKRFAGTRAATLGWILEHALKPVQLLLFGIFLQAGLAQITMSEPLADFCSDVASLLIYVAIFWAAFNAVGVIDQLLKKMSDKTESGLDDMIVPLVRKTLRAFVLILAVMLIADNVFGQDIGAWLAGLGIAGLAVSLAAQDSLRNVFGSITIVFDRPFKVGDRVAYAGYDGPVEEIGFRSTKIRTLTGPLVTVPNSRIVNDPVENIGARPYIRRFMNVTITYDTPREKIEQAVQIIREILEEPGIAEPVHGSVGDEELPPKVY